MLLVVDLLPDVGCNWTVAKTRCISRFVVSWMGAYRDHRLKQRDDPPMVEDLEGFTTEDHSAHVAPIRRSMD